KQQIEGGVVMATGAVLTEELLVDKATGLPLNPNLLDYKPLSIKDAPLADVIIVEKPKAYGVFGAHGLGEPPMAPPAPAIVNAVYNAVGVWVTEMPLTRDKLLAAIKAGQEGGRNEGIRALRRDDRRGCGRATPQELRPGGQGGGRRERSHRRDDEGLGPRQGIAVPRRSHRPDHHQGPDQHLGWRHHQHRRGGDSERRHR